MRLNILCLIITLAVGSLYAANPPSELDSLYQVAKEDPNNSDVITRLNSLCNRLYGNFTDTVRWYSEQQVYLCREVGNTHYEGRGLSMWGICMELKGKLDSAVVLHGMAKDIGERTKDDQLLTDVYNNLGIAYSYQGLFALSVEYTLKSLALAEEQNDKRRQAMLYNNLGLRYSELENHSLAIENLKEAVTLNNELENTNALISNYINLGNAYFNLNEYKMGIEYGKKAVSLAKTVNQRVDLNIAYGALAHHYISMDELAVAKLYNDSALVVAEDINDEIGIQEARNVNGLIAFAEGDYDKAKALLNEALAFFEEMKYMSYILDIRMKLATMYHEEGMDDLAYYHMRRHALAKDSIFTDQKDKAMRQVSIYKEAKQEREKKLLEEKIALRDENIKQEQKLSNTLIIIGVLLLLLLIGLAHRYRYEKRTKKTLANKNLIIEKEKARSDELLLNILPASVAEELKANGVAEAKDFEEVTVLFTDFVEFTKTTQEISAKELVEELNTCFKAFDEIVTRFGLEKIKTIGDAYMAASGLNIPKRAGAYESVLAAFEMQEFVQRRKLEREAQNEVFFDMRCGMNTGQVVAGIVGIKKFQYDIWGDAVNIASRMESMADVGKVNISQTTYDLLKDRTDLYFESRGKINVKGKGEMAMWFVSKKNESA